MRTVLAITIAALTALGAGTALAQAQPPPAPPQDFSTVQVVAHTLAGNVHYLEGRGGNIGVLIGSDGVVIIDDQFAPLTEKIVAAIGTLTDEDIRFVVNTHVHPDHMGGVASVRCPDRRFDHRARQRAGPHDARHSRWTTRAGCCMADRHVRG